MFGLPKVVQTDQGTNFKSRTFAQALKTLGVKHVTSSPYHPESQGALERFHQTLKAMLPKYCMDTGRDWDEVIPFLLFAAREAVQESLGFIPAELVFGHEVKAPLTVLKEQLVLHFKTVKNIPEYVSRMRKAVACEFYPGDKVLVLLPVLGSSLQTKFSGPYIVERKLNETNYCSNPDRRQQTTLCHVNMMKLYHSREDRIQPLWLSQFCL